MKAKTNLKITSAIVGVCSLVACVPANQTIAVIEGQTREANRDLEYERGETQKHLRTRASLEAQLASLRAKKKSFEASDPVGNRDEIQKLNLQIASLERDLRTRL
jgi:septal ring factor EnvC (AmiA/AmiB activator)